MRSRCPECGQTYSPKGGGHCRGGAYGGCCRTFTSDAAAGFHRIGGHSGGPDGPRRCVADMADDWRFRRDGTPWLVPWRLTPRGWTNSLPMTSEEIAAKNGPIAGRSGDSSAVGPPGAGRGSDAGSSAL